KAAADLEAVARFAKDVSASVRLLTELLLADHRHPDPSPVPRYENELEAVAAALGVAGPRPRLPRNPGGDDGRNALNIARRGDPSARHVPLDGESLADAAGVRYARARRIELPLATTALPPERVTGPAAQAAQIAWEMWNRT